MSGDSGQVVTVSTSPAHSFSKALRSEIMLLAGLGVEGDAHLGVTVQHLSRIAADKTQPNLRQVHLIHAELFDELTGKGFAIAAGDMGENLTTIGIDLLALPRGTILHLGNKAQVEVMGLRNPCKQLDDFQRGLLAAVLDRDETGGLIRKAGIMGVIRAGGLVRPGDAIRVTLPDGPHVRLERV